jgi:hypothetical protein
MLGKSDPARDHPLRAGRTAGTRLIYFSAANHRVHTVWTGRCRLRNRMLQAFTDVFVYEDDLECQAKVVADAEVGVYP